MTKSFRLFGGLALLSVLLLSSLNGQSAAQVIEKARAQLGSESALNNVKSLRYSGTVKIHVDQDPENPESAPRVVEGKTVLILEKSASGAYRQRHEFNTEEIEEITVLNGYNGWRYVRSKADNEWRFTNFSPDLLLRFQVTTAESLGFFHGYKGLFGKVEDLGTEQWNGKNARVLRFRYDEYIFFDRIFDASTSKLLATRDSNGVEIVEEGDQVVEGIRFPKIVKYIRDGKVVREDNYSEVQINVASDRKNYDYPTNLITEGGLPASRL